MPIRRLLFPLLLAPAFALSAQAPRALPVTRDVHIDAATADLNSIFGFTLSPWGDFLLADSHDQDIRVFSSHGIKPPIGRKGGGPGEFVNVTRIGFVGDTLWARDPNNDRISFFSGPEYKYKRAVREPVAIAPVKGVDPESELYVQAVTRNGDLRGVAAPHPSARRLPWMAGVDSGDIVVVRTAVDGSFRNRVLVIARNKCAIWFAVGQSRGGIHIPFCPERVGTDEDGTADVLSADTDRSPDGTWRVQVTVAGENGTTRFTRVIGTAAVTIPKAVRDSAIAERKKGWQKQSPAWQAAIPHFDVPTVYPPVRAVLLGQDGTAWIDIRTRNEAHTWYLLDGNGATIGTVTVPANVSLLAADGRVVWGTEMNDDGLQGVVRYTVRRP